MSHPLLCVPFKLLSLKSPTPLTSLSLSLSHSHTHTFASLQISGVLAVLQLHSSKIYSRKVMGFSYILTLIFSLVTLQQFQVTKSATVVVDGVSQWKNPQLQIGETVIFQHKYHYSLYIFKNQEAFTLCNFTLATLLTKPNSTVYTWHTSRPGFFYFSFYNGSNQACVQGQKLAVKVTSSTPPLQAPAPPPLTTTPPPSSGGGFVASSPAFPWPFQPREAASPSPAPASPLSAAAPDKEGIPFINSNPAVPLPTGEVDSATIRPLPTSAHHRSKQVVTGVERALSCLILLLMIIML